MKIQQLLDHHQIQRNPFSDEDAQIDRVFKDGCIDSTYHPTWDKVYGDPAEPATSVVFGEKGSGKTAMCLQIAKHLEQFNRQNPDERLFIIHYDDFNPFLDRFRAHFGSRRRLDRVLAEWRLWDHMDAILSLAVTGLTDHILQVKQPSHAVPVQINQDDVHQLDHHQARDLLLLAACYDQSTAQTSKGRWYHLKRRLKFWSVKAYWDFVLAIIWTILAITLIGFSLAYGLTPPVQTFGSAAGILLVWLVIILIGWGPWLWRAWNNLIRANSIVRHMRIANHDTSPLWQKLMNFSGSELATQPLPNKDRTDDRYELLCKFQGILHTLGYTGVIVLVDRLDEPHLINGSAELMKTVLWPMLDNKFLKHPGLGLKLMLPIELTRFIDREDRDFYQRARLDKQNMVSSFQWTGEALYDVTNARIAACSADGAQPTLRNLFDPALTDQRLLGAFRSLRVPRHLFKFVYRLLVSHCNAHTDREPVWTISAETFESELALYSRDQDAFDRGLGAG